MLPCFGLKNLIEKVNDEFFNAPVIEYIFVILQVQTLSPGLYYVKILDSSFYTSSFKMHSKSADDMPPNLTSLEN